MKWSSTGLVSCLKLSFLNAARVKWSFNLHPSNRISFSRFELRIESSISSALTRQWSFADVLFLFFVSKFASLSRFSLAKEVGGGIRSLTLWISSCLLTLKTTVPWPITIVTHWNRKLKIQNYRDFQQRFRAKAPPSTKDFNSKFEF